MESHGMHPGTFAAIGANELAKHVAGHAIVGLAEATQASADRAEANEMSNGIAACQGHQVATQSTFAPRSAQPRQQILRSNRQERSMPAPCNTPSIGPSISRTRSSITTSSCRSDTSQA